MFQRLTTAASLRTAQLEIAALLREHAEWLCVLDRGETQALHRNEIDISIAHERLMLSCWTEKGSRSWRIRAWEWTGQLLLLQASRRMGAETPLLELVPRVSAAAAAGAIRAARKLRCDKLAQLAAAFQLDTRVERAALSPGTRPGQPGRYARILLRRQHARIAVTGTVVSGQAAAVDAFLSASLLWFTSLAERLKPPYIDQLWLIVSDTQLRPLLQRVALLRDGLRDAVQVFTVNEDLTLLRAASCPDRRELWTRKLIGFPPVPIRALSSQAKAIIGEAPEAIDVVQGRHGETLRYFGLPFARVRSLFGREKVWFGLGRVARRLLDESTRREWESLLEDLRQYRSPSPLDPRHAFYRSAGEAWLESLLRRDITRLDPGLIIAPLHAQFRTARGGKSGIRPVDLLALRRDGRLVVIELKVAEDREHVLQGVDYWRRVEAHRRRGHITRARLFGDLRMRDEPPLVYLVAPMLRFHPSFQILARCIASDIEVYRFDINEDWRSGVRVMRRIRMN